jgi:hypothetical protein
MGSGHKKRTGLSESEIARFLHAATALHEACCAPLIAPWGDHGHTLTDLNQAICAAIRTITGREAEWGCRSSTGPAGSMPPRKFHRPPCGVRFTSADFYGTLPAQQANPMEGGHQCRSTAATCSPALPSRFPLLP